MSYAQVAQHQKELRAQKEKQNKEKLVGEQATQNNKQAVIDKNSVAIGRIQNDKESSKSK